MSTLHEVPARTGAPVTAGALTFDEACARVLDFLSEHVPMGAWAVTCRIDGRQVFLHVRDRAYGLRDGHWSVWSESLCQHVVDADGPVIVPDATAVPRYADAAVARELPVGAYAGVPVLDGEGRVFGTLCGLDPQPQPPEVARHAQVLELMATLLGQALVGERLRARSEARDAVLRWRTLHDDLTGLANRAAFTERLSESLERYRRRPLAVLSIDIDDLHAVNDAFGRGGGDELLKRLAERLRDVVGGRGTVARLGGDRFAVLVEREVPGSAHTHAMALADRVSEAVAQRFTLADRRVGVGVSMGVAAVPADGPAPTPEDVLTHTELALDAARRAGDGRPVLYRPSARPSRPHDLHLRDPLRRAVATGSVRTVFQPIVDLASRRVTALECLARWEHGGQQISPAVFVPLAARSNLLPALTGAVLDRACAQLARWAAAGQEDVRVGVNVPPSVLVDRGFPRVVAEHAHRHGVRPSRLVLEITEDALLQDPPTARDVAHRLHEAGFLLSLDDFGTGYSSLLHLRSIPLDSVKIDRGFTADVDTCPRSQQFLRALLALGRDLGLTVVVEGVERPAQEDVLRELGAGQVQGFLYGEPAPAEDLVLDGLTERPLTRGA